MRGKGGERRREKEKKGSGEGRGARQREPSLHWMQFFLFSPLPTTLLFSVAVAVGEWARHTHTHTTNHFELCDKCTGKWKPRPHVSCISMAVNYSGGRGRRLGLWGPKQPKVHSGAILGNYVGLLVLQPARAPLGVQGTVVGGGIILGSTLQGETVKGVLGVYGGVQQGLENEGRGATKGSWRREQLDAHLDYQGTEDGTASFPDFAKDSQP